MTDTRTNPDRFYNPSACAACLLQGGRYAPEQRIASCRIDPLIKSCNFGRRNAPIGEAHNPHHPNRPLQTNGEDVLDTDEPARMGHLLAVDANLSARDKCLRHGAGLRETRVAQPLVEALAVVRYRRPPSSSAP